MKCYNCGETLTEHNFCVKCGVDVRKYKKIIAMSNVFYNEGLEKANVRDLSGAINSLRQCIKLNKNHKDARNLLGLIHFEMGEHIVAFKEWVISKNLCSTNNIADKYLSMIQGNPGRLDLMNQTAKKFNQALLFCNQGNLDLAVIQLRKVLSMNSRFLKAHQLLALVYIQREAIDKAKKEIDRSMKIDRNNTITLRYLREIEEPEFSVDSVEKHESSKKKDSNIISYKSGNETIIQPINIKEPKVFTSIFNVVVGIVMGLLVAWFLILPGQIQKERRGLSDDLKTVSEQLDVKTVRITELEEEINSLESEKELMSQEMLDYAGTDGTLKNMQYVINAVITYMQTPNDLDTIGEYLNKIDIKNITGESAETFTKLYRELLLKVGPALGKKHYNTGMMAYDSGDYETAIVNLETAYHYDETNGDALYYLGGAYRKSEDHENALKIYKQVVELFPGTKKETSALQFIAQLEQ